MLAKIRSYNSVHQPKGSQRMYALTSRLRVFGFAVVVAVTAREVRSAYNVHELRDRKQDVLNARRFNR